MSSGQLEEIAIRDTAEQSLIDNLNTEDSANNCNTVDENFSLCKWMFIYIFGLAVVATLVILTAYYLWK
jgi:hypothetical protein